jgi:uncharacterized protein
LTTTIVDAGPLVAFYNEKDEAHEWARRHINAATSALLTSETVLTEAAYLTQRGGGNPRPLLQCLSTGILEVGISLENEAQDLARLMEKYKHLPMSLADACLVRLSEMVSDCRVLTLDRHFTIYRRFDRRIIPLIVPWHETP